ncbi:uncharacterized protein TNIN_220581 [Trichonephila inaurata madagascariensis]|uniref:Reverse transcriptase domain-containing protein n=1 Tax=Trichonephila inaurata madagascariensis TaxID=2747483 RepID=A0A8X6Y0H5_9ARAC|nr:uncharacterized protein TNIN_220581 [Trichonephila inaurata madagascariensis]
MEKSLEDVKSKRKTLRSLTTKLITKVESIIKDESISYEDKIEDLIDCKEQLLDKQNSLKELNEKIESLIKLEEIEKEVSGSEEYSERPNVNPNILILLLKFRKFRIGLISDVEKAFLQIVLAEEGRDCQRFLWADDFPPNNLNIYRNKTVTFGVKSSPFLLAATVKHYIKNYEISHPLAYKVLNEYLYVDDLITGTNTVNEALELSKHTKLLLKDANMNLRKWKTNSIELSQKWEESKFENLTHNEAEIWEGGLDWDEELGKNLRIKWEKLCKEVHSLVDLSIPRYYFKADESSEEFNEYQIVIFCDASERAYGAIAFIRYKKNSDFHVNFVSSKAHSTVALSWIRGYAKQWKPFVSNRVHEIQDLTNPQNWRFVKGEQNPADIVSRGCSAEELLKNRRLWHGPHWLTLSEENWPKNEILFQETTNEEELNI